MRNLEFHKLYELYFKDIYRYVYSKSHNESISEEIAQETFYRALEKINEFDEKMDVRAWLFVVARNTYYSYCRKHNRIIDEQELRDVPDDVNFVDQIMDREAAAQIRIFIETMSETYRDVFTLRVTTVYATVISLVSIMVLSFWLFYYGVPAKEEDIGLVTEFQISRYYYLDQEYVFHFSRSDGKSFNTFFKNIYEKNEQGEKVLVGYEVQVREPIINLNQFSTGFTFGYGYPDESGPDEDFDFTVTMKYKDSEKVYSMREEGLFVPQENLGGIDYEGIYGR